MKSAKQRVLDEINKRIVKNQAYKEKINNNSVEQDVFEFFKQSDEAKRIQNNVTYEPQILTGALDSLITKLKQRDPAIINVIIEWNEGSEIENSQIRGVSITWSNYYASKNQIEANMYIDISEMLLF